MNKMGNLLAKALSVTLSLWIFLLSPLITIASLQPVKAQSEVTSSPTATPQASETPVVAEPVAVPVPIVETTPEVTVAVVPTEVVTPTPTESPVPTASVEPEVIVPTVTEVPVVADPSQEEVVAMVEAVTEPLLEQTPTPTITPAPTLESPLVTETPIAPSPEVWTFGNVELGKEYVAPQNSGVKLTFTKLPSTAGNIKIEEITLTKEQIEKTGSLSDKAYDITSDMVDGSFSYNLSLPIPTTAKGKTVEVKFAEELSSIGTAEKIENTITRTNTSVSVKILDHFTIFIITDDDAVYSGGTWVDYATQGYSDDGVHYPTTLAAGQTATWTFSTITPDTYRVYVSWSTHSNRTQLAPYVLNYNGGSTSPIVINQERLADQTTTGSAGQWSGWYYLGTQDLNTSSNLVLTSVDNTSGTDYVIADEVLLAPNTAPTTVWVDDNYSINSTNNGHVWNYDAFTTIQEGISAVSAGGTVNIAAGTYAGDVNVSKSLTLQGVSNANLTGQITITSDHVTVDGMNITNPTVGYGIVATDHSNLTITDNTIHDIATLLDAGSAQAVAIISNTSTVVDITISGNHISNVGNLGLVYSGSGSAKGIYIGNSNGSMNFNNVTISNNVITGIYDSTSPHPVGRGAYGILVNHSTGAPATTNLVISGNTISTLEGYWAHAIGLEGNTPGASVTGNTVSGLTEHKFAHEVTFHDAFAVRIEDNAGASTVSIGAGNTFGGLPFTNVPSTVIVDSALLGIPSYSEVLIGSSYYYTDMNAFATIQAAIAAVQTGGTVNVAAGNYTEVGQIVIGKNLSITGADKTTTIIKPESDTSGTGDAGSWILVNDGITFNISKVTLDGVSRQIRQGIRFNGSGTVNDTIIQNIVQTGYMGFAVVQGYENAGPRTLNVTNSTFTNFGRVGVQTDNGGGSSTATISNNTFTCKGDGDHLDYAVTVEGGSVATITNNIISNCRGVALSDGSTSAGISVTTFFAGGTSATITGNTISDSTDGIAVGYDSSDTSTVTAHNNNLGGNIEHGVSSTAPSVNATNNWWGSISGPSSVGTGVGDNVSTNVTFDPWCLTSACSTDSSIYSTSKGVNLDGTPQDVMVGDLTIKGVTGSGSLFVAKYDAAPSTGALSTGVDGFYYDIQYTGAGPDFPLSLELAYGVSFDEAHFTSLYYYDGTWKDYRLDVPASTATIDTSADKISASLWHLTPIVPVVDTTSPAVPTLVSPPDGSVRNPAGLILDWSDVSDPSGPVTYRYQSFWPVTGHYGPVSTGTASQINASGSADRAYTWQVQACDSLNNCSAWSGPWAITVDYILPSLSFIDNVVAGPVTSDTVELSTSDLNANPDSYEYGFSSDSTCNSSDTFGNAFTSGTPFTFNTEVHNGSYICAKAADLAGNTSYLSSANPLNIDVTGPTLPGQIGWTSENPPDGSDYATGSDFAGYRTCGQSLNYSPMTNLWGTSTDAAGIAGYERKVYSPNETTLAYTSPLLTTNYQNGGGAVDGATYWVQIRAIDTLGNASAWTEKCAITYDVTAPTSSLYIQADLAETLNIVGTAGWHGNGWYKSYDNLNLRIATGDTSVDFTRYQILSGDQSCPTYGSGYSVPQSHDTNVNGDINGSADGVYTLCYYAEDLAGNTEASIQKQLLKKDTTVPDFKIDSVTGNNVGGVYYNNTNTLGITIEAKDPSSGYTRTRFDLYNADVGHNCTSYIDWNQDNLTPAEGVVSRTLTKSGLADGNYCMRLWIYDDVQNIDWTPTGGDGWVKFVIDTSAPTISVDSLKYGAVTVPTFITNENTPTIVGTYAGDNLGSINVNLNGTDVAVSPAGGVWEAYFSATIPDGTYTITATITDLAVNTSTDTQEIVIDIVAPNATNTYYKSGVEITDPIAYVNAVSVLTFTGLYTDASPSSGLNTDSYVIFQAQDDHSFGFSANGKLAYCSWRSLPNLVTLPTDGNLTTPVDFTNCIATLPDGEYYLAHQVYDNATRKDIPSINQFRDVLGLHFIVETIKPVTTDSGTDGDWHSIDVTVTFSCTDVDGSGCYKTYYKVDGGSYIEGTSVTLGAEGVHTINYYSVDNAGNIEDEKTTAHTVKIDKTAPEVTVPANQTLEATSPEGYFYIFSPLATDSGSSVMSLACAPTEAGFQYPLGGPYTVNCTAADWAGNLSTSSFTVTVVDTTKPSVTDVADATVYEGDAMPVVSVTGTDAVGVKKICFTLDSSNDSMDSLTEQCDTITPTSPAVWDVNTMFSLPATVDLSVIPAGTYFFTYWVEDPSGNLSDSQTTTYTVVDVVPAVTVSASQNGNDSYTFTANPTGGNAPYTYLWSGNCSGTNSTYTTGTTPGTYNCTVTVTDADGDTASDSETRTIEEPAPQQQGQGEEVGGFDILGAQTEETPTPSPTPEDGQVEGARTCDATTKLTGEIFLDKNKNGIRDAGEQIFAGITGKVTYMLDGKEILVGTFTSDNNGKWEMDVCPGEYIITLNESSIPKGFKAESLTKTVNVAEGQGATLAAITLLAAAAAGFSWWWLLLIAVIAGVGAFIYRRRQAALETT